MTRPVNVLIAAASIFVAAFISGSLEPLRNVLAACLSGALITAAANAINDYFDLEIDRINKPERPLPKGLLSRKQAFIFSMGCFSAGILLSTLIGWTAFIIAASTSLMLYFYSAALKRTVIWGNLAVSLATALAFIYGGIAVGRFSSALIPAGFAFAMHLGREIIKDMEDVEGDKAYNAFTLPVKHGLLPARWVATCVLAALLLSTLLPHFMQIYGRWYLVIVMLGVNTVLIFTIFSLWLASGRKNFRRLSAILKADMLMGLLAIYAGSW